MIPNKSAGKRQSPLLVGIIVDVSSSMRRNWKNNDGRKMPRIEVIRDALNGYFQKSSPSSLRKIEGSRTIALFCLGMGFQRPMYWSDVKISYDEEKSLGTVAKQSIQTDIVCDLLALSEIIPNKSKLDKLEATLNQKWQTYADRLLRQAKIDNNVYEQLKEHIRSEIYQSAHRRLYRGIPYVLYTRLQNSPVVHRFQFLQTVITKLAQHVKGWEGKIEELSAKASEAYFNGILEQARRTLDEEKQKYAEFIQNTLDDFASNHSNLLLVLITLGHDAERAFDYFDEDKVRQIAQQIYEHLDNQVRRSILLAWTLNRGGLFLTVKRLGASLNSKEIQTLTEKCVRKHSWEVLEPFVSDTVRNIFTTNFKIQAEKQIPNWIGLAASREVSRSLKQVANLLPDSLQDSIYSDKYMFGSTPIEDAIKKASVRFLDRSWKNREKILVIISDGEFETDSPLITALLLKKAGVTVISCYLTNQDVITKLTNSNSRFWPTGAKKLFDMASSIEENEQIAKTILDKGFQVTEGTKLFLQVNNSRLLESMLEVVLST